MSLTELVDVLDALLQGPNGLLEVGFAFLSLPLAILGDLSIHGWARMSGFAKSKFKGFIGLLITFVFTFMVNLLLLFLCTSLNWCHLLLITVIDVVFNSCCYLLILSSCFGSIASFFWGVRQLLDAPFGSCRVNGPGLDGLVVAVTDLAVAVHGRLMLALELLPMFHGIQCHQYGVAVKCSVHLGLTLNHDVNLEIAYSQESPLSELWVEPDNALEEIALGKPGFDQLLIGQMLLEYLSVRVPVHAARFSTRPVLLCFSLLLSMVLFILALREDLVGELLLLFPIKLTSSATSLMTLSRLLMPSRVFYLPLSS